MFERNMFKMCETFYFWNQSNDKKNLVGFKVCSWWINIWNNWLKKGNIVRISIILVVWLIPWYTIWFIGFVKQFVFSTFGTADTALSYDKLSNKISFQKGPVISIKMRPKNKCSVVSFVSEVNLSDQNKIWF